MSLCCVCGSNEGKYKCPKCRAPYCSVNCSKIHRRQCSGEVVEEQTEMVLPISPFETFRQHPKIVAALGDERLQKIIKRIDSAEDRESELIREMRVNMYFREFVEDLLRAAPRSIEP